MRREPIVFLVDDDLKLRNDLSDLLQTSGFYVEGFASAEEFTSKYKRYKGDSPCCLLLDLRLGGMSGMQLLRDLHGSNRALPVIIITGHGNVAVAVEAMKLGAADFLEKPLDHQVVLARVSAALKGAGEERLNFIAASDARNRLFALTPREREMLQLVVRGKSSKQIAAKTGLSYRTVNNHRTHLLAKTRAENTADLVRLALLAGIATNPADEH